MKRKVGILCIVMALCILLLVMPSAAANVAATVSPSTIAQGGTIFINGTAEGLPPSVAIWILGNNYVFRTTDTVNVDGSFSYEINQIITQTMNTGQYFIVVQHPGTNGLYDIDWAGPPAGFVYDYSGTSPVSLFRIWGPGSLRGSDAADALVQGINQPLVDDVCTELQFQIVSSSKIGVYQNGAWIIDNNDNFAWDGVPTDTVYSFGGSVFIPVYGDWNGDSKPEVGAYSNGLWYLDYNGNGMYEGSVVDRTASFGSDGYKPVVGDWDGTGKDKIGVEKDGFWAIDYNGNFIWDGTPTDKFAAFGIAGYIPVIGDWNGNGKDKIGSHKDGFWVIDYDGSYTWDGTITDRFAGFGLTADKPVIGDWDGTGKDKIGSEKNGFWAIDYNGNYLWDGAVTDRFAGFGSTSDIPVIGDWNGNGRTKIGSFKGGFWAVDYNGNYLWDGAVNDRFAGFGQNGDSPIVGDWTQSSMTTNIQMIGNVYGLASNPSAGIDEIKFTVGLAPGAPTIDLTKMKIIFSTPTTGPVILAQGTTASGTVFTTKLNGAIAVTSLSANDQVEIDFVVVTVTPNTHMNIELRPSVGAALPFQKTAPATISSVNVLY